MEHSPNTMEKRYLVTIAKLNEGSKLHIVAVDQKKSAVIFDAIVVKELQTDTKELFTSRFGNEVSFIETQSKAD